MAVMTFDDGSTLDTGSGQSTDAPAGMLISDYGSNFSPGNLSPGATSMLDVMRYGFGRVVDYKVASLQAQNANPQYAAGPVGQVAQTQVSIGTLALIAGALALGFVLLNSKG